MVKRIVVIGPESTGKSTLCSQLAEHFKTLWCPEYAREFLLTNGKEYSYEDILTIAKGQIDLEDKYANELSIHANNNPLLFIDTDMYVMKVWCEYVFGKCHPYIITEIAKRQYDLYLLCNIDLPWTKDELREYPDEQPRRELYQLYKDILINQAVPFVEISGVEEERTRIAVDAIYSLINK
jgi:NadR type nicotinamide-nucleotide adenylyltransferase